MDERALHTVNQVWAWVETVLVALAALPGFAHGLVPGPVWAKAWRQLRVIEAMARRAITTLSVEFPRPPRQPASGMPPEPAPRPARAPSPRCAPLFDLSDPIPNPMIPSRPPEGPIVASGNLRSLDGLKARMAALQAVLDDPDAVLARYLRRRDRPRRHIFDRGIAPRLRPGRPPGYANPDFGDAEMGLLNWIHHYAVWALNGGRGPPVPGLR